MAEITRTCDSMPSFFKFQLVLKSVCLLIVLAEITRMCDTFYFLEKLLNNRSVCATNKIEDTDKTFNSASVASANTKSPSSKDHANDNKEETSIEFPCFIGDEPTCHTFPVFRSIDKEMEDFLKTHCDSVGANFIRLLREYLHGDPNWEGSRLDGCYRDKNLPKCFAGMKNYNIASPKTVEDGKRIKMPFYDGKDLNEKDVITAYEMNHFQDTDNPIASLGTHQTCLPFHLAGASVTRTGAIIELGPFAGFSSKCLATGIKSTGPGRKNSMIVYDSYNDVMNYNALSKYEWITARYPDYTRENTDFLQLWKDTVQYIYPAAEPKQMYATRETLNDSVLGGNSLNVLVVDSIKKKNDLHSQLGNLTIPAGIVFFMNDFQMAKDNIIQIYSCFRNHMMPVFSSFIEQWAFVTTKSFNVDQPWVHKCYTDVADNMEEAMNVATKQAAADIEFLGGLTDNKTENEALRYWIDRASGILHSTFAYTKTHGWS